MLHPQTYYVVTCDHEDGCDEHRAGGPDGQRTERASLLLGWTAVQASETTEEGHLCPRHSVPGTAVADKLRTALHQIDQHLADAMRRAFGVRVPTTPAPSGWRGASANFVILDEVADFGPPRPGIRSPKAGPRRDVMGHAVHDCPVIPFAPGQTVAGIDYAGGPLVVLTGVPTLPEGVRAYRTGYTNGLAEGLKRAAESIEELRDRVPDEYEEAHEALHDAADAVQGATPTPAGPFDAERWADVHVSIVRVESARDGWHEAVCTGDRPDGSDCGWVTTGTDGTCETAALEHAETHAPQATTSRKSSLTAALVDAADALATHSRDWSEQSNDAWLWAILCGWSNSDLADLAAQHGWTDRHVAHLRECRAAVAALLGVAAVPDDEPTEEGASELTHSTLFRHGWRCTKPHATGSEHDQDDYATVEGARAGLRTHDAEHHEAPAPAPPAEELCGALPIFAPGNPSCSKPASHVRGPDAGWKRECHSNGLLEWRVDGAGGSAYPPPAPPGGEDADPAVGREYRHRRTGIRAWVLEVTAATVRIRDWASEPPRWLPIDDFTATYERLTPTSGKGETP